jgi:hypothetical protein
VSGTLRELAPRLAKIKRRSKPMTINGAPPPSGEHDRSDWEVTLRAAIIAAWLNPGRRDSWRDYYGIAPDDPAKAHQSELLERLGILGTIFDCILKAPLHLHSAEHLLLLEHLVGSWRQLVIAKEIPAQLRPPPPDAVEDPWWKAQALAGWPYEIDKSASK